MEQEKNQAGNSEETQAKNPDETSVIFDERFVKTKNFGDVKIPQLSYARLAKITPALNAIMLRLKAEGVEINPLSFTPTLSDLAKVYLSVMPESIEIMCAMTDLNPDDFDNLSVVEGGQILLVCVNQSWREVAPFFVTFIQQKQEDKPE